MKKFIYFAAAVSLGALLAGCAKNEAVVSAPDAPDQLICFDAPVVGVPTKAKVGYPTSYPSFHVYAQVHTPYYKGWDDSKKYIDTEVKYDSSLDPDAWVPYPDAYYWPKNLDYQLTFFAYSPHGATGASITSDGVQFKDYVVNIPGKEDLLYSKITYNQISTVITDESNTGSPEHGDTPAYQGVNILFQHALSSIQFKVKTAATYSTTQIYLTGITLNGIWSKGIFNQHLTTSGDVSTKGVGGTDAPQWTVDTSDPLNKKEYTYYAGSYEVGPGLEGALVPGPFGYPYGTEIILLPQDLAAGVQTATITYTMQSGTAPAVPCVKTVDLRKDSVIESWLLGKRYVYTIVIGLERIYFAPEVEDWESGTSTDIEI